MPPPPTTTSPFLAAWRASQRLPSLIGAPLFGAYIRLVAPYSGSIRPRVVRLDASRCEIRVRERWALRNPFRSIHAVALMNLGELTSGLAMMVQLQERGRLGIVTSLRAEYYKKARGTVTGVAEVSDELEQWLETGQGGQVTVDTDIMDEAGYKVATCTATWVIKAQKK
ncbi:hypothetical protein RI367_007941 [Sorochytrium milnesiophthora]